MGHPDYTEEEADFVLNRDIFINEDAKIENCVKSVGIVSNKTILSRHPWVDNIERELNQLEEDRQQELDEMEATQAIMAIETNNGSTKSSKSSTKSSEKDE